MCVWPGALFAATSERSASMTGVYCGLVRLLLNWPFIYLHRLDFILGTAHTLCHGGGLFMGPPTMSASNARERASHAYFGPGHGLHESAPGWPLWPAARLVDSAPLSTGRFHCMTCPLSFCRAYVWACPWMVVSIARVLPRAYFSRRHGFHASTSRTPRGHRA
jgi:hypothetical protein